MRNVQGLGLLFVFMILWLIHGSVYAQSDIWSSLNGPYSVIVEDLIKTSQGRLIAATRNGLITSTDQGDTWNHLNVGDVWEPFFTCLLEDSLGTIFAGTALDGIWKSTDGGHNWSLTEKTLFSSVEIRSLATGPQKELLAGATNGLYRSTDDGISWTKLPLGQFQVEALSIKKDGVLFAGTFDSGIYRSTNSGSTWEQLQPDSLRPKSKYILDLALTYGGILFAATPVGTYRSSDNGQSWSRVLSEETSGLFVTEQNELYAGIWDPGTTGDPFHIVRSTDKGATWPELGWNRYNYYLEAGCLFADSSGNIFVGTFGGGVIRSTNDGSNWSACNISYSKTFGANDYQSVTQIVLDPISGRIYVATPSGIFRSTEDDSGWILLGQLGGTVAINNTGTILALQDNDIFRYDRQSGLWKAVVRSAGTRGFSRVTSDRSGAFYAGTLEGFVYSSFDQGITWRKSSLPIPRTNENNAITGIAVVVGVVYALDNYGEFFESVDSARTWTRKTNIGIPYAFCLTSNAASHLFAGGASANVLRSMDGGTTWESFPLPAVHGVSVTDIVVDMLGHIYASGSTSDNRFGDAGVYRSTDNGENWQAHKTGLNGEQFKSLAVSKDNVLYAGTEYGVFRKTQIVTSVSSPPKVNSTSFSLKQNYPNPFNPSTTIQFSLPKEEHVGLRIFNLLGEEVAALISGRLRAGAHSVQWNASAVPSGVYFYRLQAGDFSETKKLILIR